MANLNREGLAEDVQKRFDALSKCQQWAVEAIMEAWDDSIEQALEIVESGDYEFYPDTFTMTDLAYEFVQAGYFGDPNAMGPLTNYIDYKGLGADLSYHGYRETRYGIIRTDR